MVFVLLLFGRLVCVFSRACCFGGYFVDFVCGFTGVSVVWVLNGLVSLLLVLV